jgi:hypothetical protein
VPLSPRQLATIRVPSLFGRSSPMTTPTSRTTKRKPAPSPASGPQAQARAHRQAYHRRKTRAQAKSEALRQQEAAQVEALPVHHPHAAGIDVGSRSHWVCVGFTTAADAGLIQEFPAHTAGLKAIAAFLHEHQVNTVAMESTGIYWIALYELLASEGFEVLLVDPSYTRQLRGRPKTDRRDCQWIYRLHSVGRLAAAFRPDEKTCQLRAYLRQRANLVRQGSQHGQHMPKALEQMNLKLTEILSDITGAPGRAIIRAIRRGTRAPEKLAKYRDQGCKGQRGGDRPGLDRVVPGRAPVRAEASLRGLAVLLGAGGEGGRADRSAVGADEVRSGLAAADAEEASEEPEDQRAAVRRADGVVLCGGTGLDGDRRDQRADGVDDHQRDRPGGVEVRDGEEVR